MTPRKSRKSCSTKQNVVRSTHQINSVARLTDEVLPAKPPSRRDVLEDTLLRVSRFDPLCADVSNELLGAWISLASEVQTIKYAIAAHYVFRLRAGLQPDTTRVTTGDITMSEIMTTMNLLTKNQSSEYVDATQGTIFDDTVVNREAERRSDSSETPHPSSVCSVLGMESGYNTKDTLRAIYRSLCKFRAVEDGYLDITGARQTILRN